MQRFAIIITSVLWLQKPATTKSSIPLSAIAPHAKG